MKNNVIVFKTQDIIYVILKGAAPLSLNFI
jgi:hypothetical protein